MKRKSWVTVEVVIDISRKVGHAPATTYTVLLGHRNRSNGDCFISQEKLAEEMQVKADAVKKNLNKLKKAGFIDWKQGNNYSHQSNSYIFLKEYEGEGEEAEKEKESKKKVDKIIKDRAKAKKKAEQDKEDNNESEERAIEPAPVSNVTPIPSMKKKFEPKSITAGINVPPLPIHLRQEQKSNNTHTSEINKPKDNTPKASNKDHQENKELVKKLKNLMAEHKALREQGKIEAPWEYNFEDNDKLIKRKEYSRANNIIKHEIINLEGFLDRFKRREAEYSKIIERLNSQECEALSDFHRREINKMIEDKSEVENINNTLNYLLRALNKAS